MARKISGPSLSASYFHVADPVVALILLRLDSLEPGELDRFLAFHQQQIAVGGVVV
jgi:hypothetical protein